MQVTREEIPPQVIAGLTPAQRDQLFETLKEGKGVFVHTSAIRGQKKPLQIPSELEVVQIGFNGEKGKIQVTAANTPGFRRLGEAPEKMPRAKEIRVTWAGERGPVLSRGGEEPVILLDKSLPLAPPGTPFVVTGTERRKSRRNPQREVVIATGYYLNPDKRLVLHDRPRSGVFPQHPLWGNFVVYDEVWRRYNRREPEVSPICNTWIPEGWLECQTPLKDARGRHERILLVADKYTESVRKMITFSAFHQRLLSLPWQEAFADIWIKYRDRTGPYPDLKAEAHEIFRKRLFSWQERQDLPPYDEQNPDELARVLQHLLYNLAPEVLKVTKSRLAQSPNIQPYISRLLNRYAQTIVAEFPTVGSLSKLTPVNVIKILAKCIEMDDSTQRTPENHWAITSVASTQSASYWDVCVNVFGFTEVETAAWFWVESREAAALADEVNAYYHSYRRAVPTGYTTKEHIYAAYVKLGRRPTPEDFIDKELEAKYYPVEVTIPGLGEVPVAGYATFRSPFTGTIETEVQLDLTDRQIVRIERLPEHLGDARHAKLSRTWLDRITSKDLQQFQEKVQKRFFEGKLAQLLDGTPEMWSELYTNSPTFFKLIANIVATSDQILGALTEDEVSEVGRELLREMGRTLGRAMDFRVASLEQMPPFDITIYSDPDFGEVRIVPKYVSITPTGVRFIGVKGVWETYPGDRYSWDVVHKIFEARFGNIPETSCGIEGCDKTKRVVTKGGLVYLECPEHPVENTRGVMRFDEDNPLYGNVVFLPDKYPGETFGIALGSAGCAVYEGPLRMSLTYYPVNQILRELAEVELFLRRIGKIAPDDTPETNRLLARIYEGRETLEKAVRDTM